MTAFRIVGFCVLAAIVYGIALDMVTAHLCVEYFTVGHPPIFPTDTPWVLALGWGVTASWWVGLLLGILTAAAARAGVRRKVRFAEVRKLLTRLFLVTAALAFLGGLCGAALARAGLITLVPHLASLIPPGRQILFLADLWAHTASYGAALCGGVVLAILLLLRRRQPSAQAAPSPLPPGLAPFLRQSHEPPPVTAQLGWTFHHLGIPTDIPRPDETHLPAYGLHVSGYTSSPYGIEWMRFDEDSCLPEIIRTVPHVAFQVPDLDAALQGQEILFPPTAPSDGVRSAMILWNGAPVELISFPGKASAKDGGA